MTIPPYELPVPILPGDIDELGHVNNVVYLRWVQDVAIAHWTRESTADEQAAVAWVALRHELDYKHPALPGDSIVARTWVGAAETFRFERLTEILRAPDGKVLARARTVWCPIARGTGKPTKVSDSVRERFSASGDAPPPA